MSNSFIQENSYHSEKIQTKEYFLESIGFYIIQKIREEDLTEDQISLREESCLQKENESSPEFDPAFSETEIVRKVTITELIINNRDILVSLEDFYEEDCQLSMLNWAMKIHKRLKAKSKEKSKEKEEINFLNRNYCFQNKYLLNKNEEILLLNIINIFETFPIKPEDLKTLNFIEKLNKLKKGMKKSNYSYLYKKIKNLIHFWRSILKIFDTKHHQNQQNQSAHNNIIIISDNNNENIKEKEESDLSLSLLDTMEITDQSNNKKKNVSWKNDDILVEEVFFNPDEAPFM